MELYLIYPIYTAILGIILISVVPRKDIKELAFYGIVLGGVMDTLVIFLVSFLLNLVKYINYGPFGFKGLPFFPPIAWTIWFIMIFYFIPDKNIHKHIYIITAAGYSVMFSNILAKLGIMRWNKSEIIIPFIIYLVWYYTVVWIKKRID